MPCHKVTQGKLYATDISTVYYDRSSVKWSGSIIPGTHHTSLGVQRPSFKQNEVGPCQELKSGHPAMSCSIC